MSEGVQFDRRSAERIGHATKRVERMPRGGNADRRGSNNGVRVGFFVLNEAMAAATDSLTGAVAVRATFYAGDPANPPVMGAAQATYSPQELITSATPRVEWVVNRSLDLAANEDAAGMAVRVNGEWLVFWVDCTAGT